jgi:hypothetical protein
VPIRKPGKLPYATIAGVSARAGNDRLEVHTDALGRPSFLLDDVLATGGTMRLPRPRPSIAPILSPSSSSSLLGGWPKLEPTEVSA